MSKVWIIRGRFLFVVLVAILTVGSLPGLFESSAYGKKIEKARNKVRKGTGKSSAPSSIRTDDDDEEGADVDCALLLYFLGLCNDEDERESENDNARSGMVAAQEAPVEVADSPRGVKNPLVFTARSEYLHGKGGNDLYSLFAVDAGFGSKNGALLICFEGLNLVELDDGDVKVDEASIIPISLGLRISQELQHFTVGWGWAFTDGLDQAEGRFIRLQYEVLPDTGPLRPFLRPSARMMWFRDVFFNHLRLDGGVLLAHHVEIFLGVSRASLEEIEWNWVHFGAAVRL